MRPIYQCLSMLVVHIYAFLAFHLQSFPGNDDGYNLPFCLLALLFPHQVDDPSWGCVNILVGASTQQAP